MSLSDPIADMLTRIRNASSARHDSVLMPASKIKIAIANVLQGRRLHSRLLRRQEEGKPQPNLKVDLSYAGRKQPVLNGLKRVSKPGLRVYVQRREIPRVYGGLGMAILSTPKGVMRGRRPAATKLAARSSATCGRGIDDVTHWPPTRSCPRRSHRHRRRGQLCHVKGPKGELFRQFPLSITFGRDEDVINVSRPNDEGKQRSLHGLSRSLLSNMVIGVTTGFTKVSKCRVSAIAPRCRARTCSWPLASRTP